MSTPAVTPATTGDQPGGTQTTTPPAGDPPVATTPATTQTQTDSESEVEKAYAKLRAAEDREKQKDAELRRLKNEALPEADRVKQENEELKAANATLTADLTKYAGERIAASKGFIDPEAAIAILTSRGTDISTKDKANKALDDLGKEKTGMVGQAPPSGGPVNPANTNTPGGNQGMNQEIRRQAGRA